MKEKIENITLSLLSDNAIKEIEKLGGEFIMTQSTPDLTNIAYTVRFKNGYQLAIAKALLFMGQTVVEITKGASRNLWDTLIFYPKEKDDGYTDPAMGDLTEDDLIKLCKEVSSRE